MLNVIYTKENQTINVNYTFDEIEFQVLINSIYERKGSVIEESETEKTVVDGESYNLTDELSKPNYVLQDGYSITGVWDINEPEKMFKFENTQPDVSGFTILTPAKDSTHEINQPVDVTVKVLPDLAYQQDWKLEAKTGTTVNGKKVTGVQEGSVEFDVVSVDLTSVRSTSSFNVIDSSEPETEAFSLDNTKAELQAELVHRGIEFNQKDNKTELLNKLK